MTLNVHPYTKKYAGQWNDLVSTAQHTSFLFHRNFMEYHQDRFLDVSTMIFMGDQLIALFPANVQSTTVFSHQGLSYGGLVFHPSVSSDLRVKCLHKLIKYYQGIGAERLCYKALPKYYLDEPQTDNTLLSYFTPQLLVEETASVINLKQAKCYHKLRKRMVARAKKRGVQVEESASYEAYWAMLTENLALRHKAEPVHVYWEITLLASRFPENIRLFEAKYDGETVGGIVLFINKKCIHAQYIASNETGRKYGALDLVVDTIIDQYQHSHAYFGLGISNNRHDQTINQGLKHWKDGFGAQDFSHCIYELTL